MRIEYFIGIAFFIFCIVAMVCLVANSIGKEKYLDATLRKLDRAKLENEALKERIRKLEILTADK